MNILPEQSWNSIATSRDARQMPRHRWYWVKEGFSPLLVRTAIEEENCGPTDLVVDPFCGSGTVPLEAAHCRMPSAGAEVNPFLAFASKTKMLAPSKQAIRLWSDRAKKAIDKSTSSPLIGLSTFANSPEKRGLFNQEVLKGFQGGWQALEPAPAAVRDVLRLCALRAALECANFRRDGKALRYHDALIQRQFGREELETFFSRRVTDVLEDIRSCKLPKRSSHIEVTDSRQRLPKHFKGFKLCVTSPPYLNSFDYTDVYRPELFLGGFVQSAPDLTALRLKTIRSHVQATWDPPVDSDFGPLFQECHTAVKAKRAELWNRRIPEMIQAYFEDMRTVLSRLREVAHDDAAVWIAVSTSAYAGVEIPVDHIIAHIGKQVGWQFREIRFIRHMRSSGQQRKRLNPDENGSTNALRESIVIFDAKSLS